MRKLWLNIRMWLVRKLTNWEEYWMQSLPDYNRVFKTQDGVIIKDNAYWEQIMNISQVTPFINELAELEYRYDKMAMDMLTKNEVEGARILWATSKGVKSVVKLIIDANNKLV